MLRLVVIALMVVIAWAIMVRLYRSLKDARVDWTGWAFAAGFIAMAFWLRHVTEMG